MDKQNPEMVEFMIDLLDDGAIQALQEITNKLAHLELEIVMEGGAE